MKSLTYSRMTELSAQAHPPCQMAGTSPLGLASSSGVGFGFRSGYVSQY